jgi:hypothetical protein
MDGKTYIAVYAPGRATPVRTIVRGITSPGSLAFDSSGNLYVSNGDLPGEVAILVYKPGASSPFRRITEGLTGGVGALIFDHRGNLYTDSYYVLEYPRDGVTPMRTIRDGVNAPNDIALDGAGNLYVANGNTPSVTVYAPGKTTPFRTTTDGATYPLVPALDPVGNLYVVNSYPCSCIKVYAKGSSSVWYTIADPGAPHWLAFGPG